MDHSVRRPNSSSSRASSPGERPTSTFSRLLASQLCYFLIFLAYLILNATITNPSSQYMRIYSHLFRLLTSKLFEIPGAGSSSNNNNSALSSQSFLQNPYYFMFASLAKPDEDVELHWLKVARLLLSRFLYHLPAPLHQGWENSVHNWFSRVLPISLEGFRKPERRCRLLCIPGFECQDGG